MNTNMKEGTDMDGAVVSRRYFSDRKSEVSWGFDALDMFFPFLNKEDAEIAASTWTEELIRTEGGLPIADCPLAPEDEPGLR